MNETLVRNKQVSENALISADSQKLFVSNQLLHKKKSTRLAMKTEKLLWKNLQEAFPSELKNPLRSSAVVTFMERRKIALADLSSPDNLLEAIAKSDIREILFTGSFSEGSVFYRF